MKYNQCECEVPLPRAIFKRYPGVADWWSKCKLCGDWVRHPEVRVVTHKKDGTPRIHYLCSRSERVSHASSIPSAEKPRTTLPVVEVPRSEIVSVPTLQVLPTSVPESVSQPTIEYPKVIPVGYPASPVFTRVTSAEEEKRVTEWFARLCS